MKLLDILVENKRHFDFDIYGPPELDGLDIDVKYVFNSPQTDYEVLFSKGVRWYPDRKETTFWVSVAYKNVWNDSAIEMTGEGKARKIVRTVFEIMEDFRDRFWDDIDGRFQGFKLDAVGGDQRRKRKRHRIYRIFAKKYFPYKELEESGTEIYIRID